MNSAVEIVLFDEHTGHSYANVVARTTQGGGVELDCGYSGPEITASSGDYDEEFHYIVKPENRDRLLLELLRELFGRERRPGRRFKEWLESHDVPYEFMFMS